MTCVVKMTGKRQVTFPVSVCRELGVQPGGSIRLERCEVEGEVAWVLRNPLNTASDWFGTLRAYAKGKPHDLSTIRRSIVRRTVKGKT